MLLIVTWLNGPVVLADTSLECGKIPGKAENESTDPQRVFSFYIPDCIHTTLS